MAPIYDAKCDTPNCPEEGRVKEVKGPRVEDNHVVDSACEACGERLRRVFSATHINLRKPTEDRTFTNSSEVGTSFKIKTKTPIMATLLENSSGKKVVQFDKSCPEHGLSSLRIEVTTGDDGRTTYKASKVPTNEA